VSTDTPQTTKYALTPSERLSLQSELPLKERWPNDAPPLTNHAIGQYANRLPSDAVEMPLAWLRGEDVEHPAVMETHNPVTPPTRRARVYNHAGKYIVVFVIAETPGYDEPGVVTIYNGQTHEHAPSRAYIAAHGPHAPDGGGD